MHRIKPSVHDFLFYFCCPYLIFLYKVDICLSFCLYQYHISCMVHWTHWTHWTHWPFCLKCWMENSVYLYICISQYICNIVSEELSTTHEQVDLYRVHKLVYWIQSVILSLKSWARLTSRLTCTGFTSLYTEYIQSVILSLKSHSL